MIMQQYSEPLCVQHCDGLNASDLSMKKLIIIVMQIDILLYILIFLVVPKLCLAVVMQS